MRQAYLQLVRYVTKRVPEGCVEIRFIDIVENDVFKFPDALKYLQKGYKPPIIAINRMVMFCGGIKYETIYRKIAALLF